MITARADTMWDIEGCAYRPAKIPAGGRPGPAASLNYGPAQHLPAGLQIGIKYDPDTVRNLNAILIKSNVSGVVSAQQTMLQVIIEQICIIDNDKSSELITFNLL